MENKINVTTHIDAFIVPNRASKFDTSTLEYSFGQDFLKNMQEVSEMNNVAYSYEEDKLVQLWYVGKESVASSNLQDHGFSVIGNDGFEYYFGAGSISSYLPVGFFKGHKEGDIVEVKYNLKPEVRLDPKLEDVEMWKSAVRYRGSQEAPQFEITFNIRLNQQDYRYCRFGNFEDALEYVC